VIGCEALGGALGNRGRRKHGEDVTSAIERESLSFNLPAGSSARGVIVTDSEHRIRFTDRGIRALLSCHEDLTGRDIAQFASAVRERFADPDDFERRTQRLMEHPTETVEDVMELVTPKGRVLHRYSAPLLNEHGNPAGRIQVYSDITRRRRLEDTNVHLYEQVRAAYDELKATQAQLVQSEKLRAVGEIASGVAHDFNNTLGVILGNIQLLQRKTEDPDMLARLQAMERAALDGAETIRRIQEFTRIQPDEPLAPVDLSRLAQTVIEVMSPTWESAMRARDRRIDVEFQPGEDAVAAGIAHEIREVLANVLLNAVQAMPDGGRIRISTGRSESQAWMRIEDTGIGMAKEVRGRIFDPFFTTKGVEGSGLGMSVAYGIVKRHRGKISVESEVGKGTSVTILLPASDGVRGSECGVRSAECGVRSSVLPARILVVDDEELFARVFVEMLSECGHAVCVARSGPEAIMQFKESPFDLVFTDLGMPEMSGWQLAKNIKELKPGTRVILLTGWGAKVDDEQLAASKIDMVLSKPVSMEDLSSAIGSVLAGRESAK